MAAFIVAIGWLASCVEKPEKPSESKTKASTKCPVVHNQSSITEAVVGNYSYTISLKQSSNTKAPELQSFVHGSNGSEWLLFGGRKNASKDNGGLHYMGANSDYSENSFPPSSFNTDMMVYDVSKDRVIAKKSLKNLMSFFDNVSTSNPVEKAYFSELKSIFENFRVTNPLVTQGGEYLYVVGGYGTAWDSIYSTSNYHTFNTFIQIHIPTMIDVLKDKPIKNPANFIRWTSNDTLKSTGGEIHKIGNRFYLCGGHDFGGDALNGQKYVDAVIPLDVTDKINSYSGLNLTVNSVISDIPTDSISKAWADNYSKFRRRDGPIVPILTRNPNDTTKYHESIAFYSGVFTPTVGAWNSAIYITPNATGSELLKTHKVDYNCKQNGVNVYSCPDFGISSELKDGTYLVHTFLPGGIGDGTSDGNLSPFTYGYTQMVFNTKKKSSQPFSDTNNVFNPGTSGCVPRYGAEAAFFPFPNPNIDYVTLSNGDASSIIDGPSTFKNVSGSMVVGYIYGGIEAMIPSPGSGNNHGFGPGLSKATGKIWEVTIHATHKQ